MHSFVTIACVSNTHTVSQMDGAIFRRTFEFPAQLWVTFQARAEAEGISLRTLLIEAMEARLAQPEKSGETPPKK